MALAINLTRTGTIAITSSSTANPSNILCAEAHGLTTGDSTTIAGHTSTPDINGIHVITRIDDTNFTIPVNVTAGGTGGTSTGPHTFNLQTIDVVINHQRAPILFTLPGGDPIMLDLGQWKTTITLSGIADFTGTNKLDGVVPIADRNDLEAMADPEVPNAWYDQTILLTDNTDSNGTIYTVKIATVKLEKKDVRDYYDFTLSCLGFLGIE